MPSEKNPGRNVSSPQLAGDLGEWSFEPVPGHTVKLTGCKPLRTFAYIAVTTSGSQQFWWHLSQAEDLSLWGSYINIKLTQKKRGDLISSFNLNV